MIYCATFFALEEQIISFSNFINQPNNHTSIIANILLTYFLDKVMSKNFHLKKNDDEKINGAAKHKFNAEYSDELEFKSKKGRKVSQRRADEKRHEFA
jgi:hypothetical protein